MAKYRHLGSETRVYPDISETLEPGEVFESDRDLSDDPNFELFKPSPAKKKAAKTDPPTED